MFYFSGVEESDNEEEDGEEGGEQQEGDEDEYDEDGEGEEEDWGEEGKKRPINYQVTRSHEWCSLPAVAAIASV